MDLSLQWCQRMTLSKMDAVAVRHTIAQPDLLQDSETWYRCQCNGRPSAKHQTLLLCRRQCDGHLIAEGSAGNPLQLLDGILLVDNRAISAAIKDVFNETRSILEPAGAVAVAGAKAYLQQRDLKVLPLPEQQLLPELHR